MSGELLDSLTLKGFGKADREYKFDAAGLLDIGGPQSLTSQEQHRVRLIAGVRGGEIMESATAQDAATWVALVLIILARNGRDYTESRIWSARLVLIGADAELDEGEYTNAVFIRIADRNAVEAEEDNEDPPVVAPLPIDSQSNGGGASSRETSDVPGSDLSLTGRLGSQRSVTSDPVTSPA